MLLGVAVSVGALYVTMHRPGIYWTQFNVVVLAPVGKSYPNNLENPPGALVSMAGLLAADWNGLDRPLLTASGETTLFGEGQRQGVQVRVPNEGSQWQPLYFSPSIDIQIVDSDPEKVAQETRRVSAELKQLLAERQDTMLIQPAQRMTTIVSPANPTINYISGSRSRAALAAALVGATSTAIAVYWTELWLIRKRSGSQSAENNEPGTAE
jgi:hypothetical protein